MSSNVKNSGFRQLLHRCIAADRRAKPKTKVIIQTLPGATFSLNSMFERAWAKIDNATNAAATLLGDWALQGLNQDVAEADSISRVK